MILINGGGSWWFCQATITCFVLELHDDFYPLLFGLGRSFSMVEMSGSSRIGAQEQRDLKKFLKFLSLKVKPKFCHLFSHQ